MRLLVDSFWRAAASCLQPRVIGLSLLPLGVMMVLSIGLGYFFWDGALAAVRGWLASAAAGTAWWGWLGRLGAEGVLAPLLLVFAVTPLIVIGSLLLVALLMTPAMLGQVVARRFAALQRRGSGSVLGSIGWSLGSTLIALGAFAVSIPLLFVPPLIVVLPPLIWGWLTYRVMSFDALAEHASVAERRALLKKHRWPLLAMGVVTGYMGAAPSVVWASFALFAVAFVILLPVAIWIYTLVFAFSSLWFTHYCLAALQAERASAQAAARERIAAAPAAGAPPAVIALPHEP